MRERVLLDDGADAFGVREATRLRGVDEDDRELVTAVPGHDAECAELDIKHVWMHRGPGAGSVSEAAAEYGRQHGIAAQMAESIVDLFEVVEIHQGQGERLAEAAVTLELLTCAAGELAGEKMGPLTGGAGGLGGLGLPGF